MKCIVKTKSEALAYNHVQESHSIISITQIGVPIREIALSRNDNTQGVLLLAFDDDNTSFSKEHAQQIKEFVEHHLSQGTETFIIHCLLGMARSPAVAAALCKYYTDDDAIWFRTKTPNMHVYRILLDTLYGEQ